jgi:hypothetical protein
LSNPTAANNPGSAS